MPPSQRTVNRATYFGKGTAADVAQHLRTLDAEVGGVFVNATLTAIQQRNLEALWLMPALDRVALILDIFRQRARSKEAVLQVQLAELQFAASRLIRGQGQSTAG
eukprot:CAMPEP_0114307658 /NCGR_PEP_ID=MMETSP0059-20121206/17587_1 /TAXON_ID=36894 /ORGANISM="Pyramimonas parkeae, Strain CCMP726" /LENGTH=104 /DNA_ID=CAMNT_0001431137 /DNA_START=393 /DNA_END=704 /DNA_ORIENTATION=+